MHHPVRWKNEVIELSFAGCCQTVQGYWEWKGNSATCRKESFPREKKWQKKAET